MSTTRSRVRIHGPSSADAPLPEPAGLRADCRRRRPITASRGSGWPSSCGRRKAKTRASRQRALPPSSCTSNTMRRTDIRRRRRNARPDLPAAAPGSRVAIDRRQGPGAGTRRAAGGSWRPPPSPVPSTARGSCRKSSPISGTITSMSMRPTRPSSIALPTYDREVIRPHLLGNFRELLEAVATSTAMLVYLDNRSSRAGAANENYGRELFELHTLGAPHYLNALYDDWKAVPGAAKGQPVGLYRRGCLRIGARLHRLDDRGWRRAWRWPHPAENRQVHLCRGLARWLPEAGAGDHDFNPFAAPAGRWTQGARPGGRSHPGTAQYRLHQTVPPPGLRYPATGPGAKGGRRLDGACETARPDRAGGAGDRDLASNSPKRRRRKSSARWSWWPASCAASASISPPTDGLLGLLEQSGQRLLRLGRRRPAIPM